VLTRFAPGGVAIESTQIYADVEDEGHAVGPLRVCAYLPHDPALEQTRQKLEEALWYLGRIQPLPAAQFQWVRETDWAEAWKQHYHPIAIGKRLVIVPAWLESPYPERVAVCMDPGMAFGTGTHPTTQLCLELLADNLQAGTLPCMIDVGCGSGILAIAALKLGVERALGVDIDPLAAKVTGENAALNGVAERLEVGPGSVREILAGNFSVRQAPLVVANILAPVILRLFEAGLSGLLTSGGTLILSGILTEQAGEVESAARHHGLRILSRHQEGDWVAIAAQSAI
jgi:ribosomal protein L11 methyltransferase